MEKIERLKTFGRLLNEESIVMIPKVQRDYAYGRDEEKVKKILEDILDKMLSAVRENRTEIFDFVYGGSYVKQGDEVAGLIPIDGQQRLTTMFLLFLYASIVQPDVDEKSISFLKKFRYETRQTATHFCEDLVGKIRQNLIKKYSADKNIRELITDSSSYLPSYNSDPTISSMLNVLEVIEKKYKKNPIDQLWTKLTERDNIQFYCISLEKFGLTDDLYIKMNARGKKLTRFEIFKSDLEKRVKDIAPALEDKLSLRIDNDWMDILWECASENKDEDKVKKADSGYMYLFNNIFRIELYRRRIEEKKDRQPLLEEIVTSEEDIQRIIQILDIISEINKSEGGIKAHWNKYFYFSDDIDGNEEGIRLFWLLAHNRKPVFHLAMERDLSVPEMIYFYALVEIKLRNIEDEEIVKKILRIVRNLVTANTRANSARYDMLAGFLDDVNLIISSNGDIKDAKTTFVKTAWDEEVYKNEKLSSIYDKLLKYENHEILQGSLMLFIDRYYTQDNSSSDLLKNLSHFEDIFKDYKNNFDALRIALINKDKNIDYSQYESSMDEQNMTRRLFVHNANDFSQFLIKNERRKNQTAILSEISSIENLDHLKTPEEKSKEFEVTDWQYYYVKYKGANIDDTKYGCYAWDDIKGKPLEMVILNSSYHSGNNIEWKMMNHILNVELGDSNIYSLDMHGSSPLVLTKSGISITITQWGWLIMDRNNHLKDKMFKGKTYALRPHTPRENAEEGNIQYLLNIADKAQGLDLVEIAKDFINDLEE